MIRDFTLKDLEHLEPNEMSVPDDDVLSILQNGDWNYTLENRGVKAVLCFTESAPGEWATFCLISKSFTARDSLELRRFMRRAEVVLKPKRIWTASKQIESVDKWHRFLGFALEKPRVFRGETYNQWVRACS